MWDCRHTRRALLARHARRTLPALARRCLAQLRAHAARKQRERAVELLYQRREHRRALLSGLSALAALARRRLRVAAFASARGWTPDAAAGGQLAVLGPGWPVFLRLAWGVAVWRERADMAAAWHRRVAEALRDVLYGGGPLPATSIRSGLVDAPGCAVGAADRSAPSLSMSHGLSGRW